MKIPSHLKKIISPQTSKETKLTTAKGQTPIEPLDLLVTFFLLAYDNDKEVASAARKSFSVIPTDTLLDIMSGEVDPLILKTIAIVYKDNEDVLLKVALHENTDDKTIFMLASRGPEGIANNIAENKERLLSNPSLIDALKSNPVVSNSIVEKAEALITQEEGHNLREKIRVMNTGEKIKLATLGNKEARSILLRDPNEMILITVLKNPRITDEELIKIANSKDTSAKILRFIAGKKKLLKNYSIKLGLVKNPKTPRTLALKFLKSLKEKDIRNISKSKSIPTVVSAAAMGIMERKSSANP
ncbi:MAG: hypothetical protein V3T96_01130 [Thermodesulfobacteriota bacterium]